MASLNFDLREDTAILLTVKPDARGQIEMLVREGIFNGRDTLEMNVQQKSYRITPVRVIETGDDYCWVRFQVARQDG